MVIYLAAMVLSVVICWRLQRIQQTDVLTPGVRTVRWGYLLLLLLLLGGVVGWRNYVGTDYGNYVDIYTLLRNQPYENIWQGSEPLFGMLNRFCADIFDDHVAVFVIMAMATVALLLYGIYRNSREYRLSIFLLIAGMYYFDLFNGMRQMMAAAIMFAALPLVKKKKWIHVGVLTLIAYGFHSSAYFVLLVYLFAAYIRPGSALMWLAVAAFLWIYLFFGQFVESLVEVLEQTESSYITYEESLVQEGYGANILRFGLAAVPPIFSLAAWRVLRNRGDTARILCNISVVNALFMLIATRHWIFARFCMYFGIYNILLWPEIIRCFEPRSRRLMTYGVVAVYFAYFWLIVHTDSNLLPYRSLLFGGTYG